MSWEGFQYHGKASSFKLRIEEQPMDKSMNGRIKAYYCEYRIRPMLEKMRDFKMKYFDSHPKTERFYGSPFPLPISTEKK